MTTETLDPTPTPEGAALVLAQDVFCVGLHGVTGQPTEEGTLPAGTAVRAVLQADSADERTFFEAPGDDGLWYRQYTWGPIVVVSRAEAEQAAVVAEALSRPLQVAPLTGRWVYALADDDSDFGTVLRVDGDRAMVAWVGGDASTWIDLCDLTVCADRASAEAAVDEARAEARAELAARKRAERDLYRRD